ncbi:hypothetical protein CRG98_048674, partial [Punica granatum]
RFLFSPVKISSGSTRSIGDLGPAGGILFGLDGFGSAVGVRDAVDRVDRLGSLGRGSLVGVGA